MEERENSSERNSTLNMTRLPHTSPQGGTWEFEDVSNVTAEHIQGIFDRTKCGVRIKQFCTADACKLLAASLVNDGTRTTYKVNWATKGDERAVPEEFWKRDLKSSDVERVGPVSMTMGDYESPQEYSKIAVNFIRRMRDMASPYLSPVDRLRLELDEALPGGARICNYPNGAKAFVGVGRVMEVSKEMLHADTGRPGCLTANIYLQLPKSGGGTNVWSYNGDYVKSPGSYLFAPGEIPDTAPVTTLMPTAGELVIWNPMNPHVVLPFEGGLRVSIQIWLKISGSLRDNNLGIEFLN